MNVDQVLDAIVERVPAPAGDPNAPPRALIFDSAYDQYRGVARVRPRRRRLVLAPRAAAGDGDRHALRRARSSASSRRDDARRVAHAGEVGYVVTGLKDVSSLRVGDTLTPTSRRATEALPGYKDVKPMVFAGLFPTDSDEYPELRDALERLKLNDARALLRAGDLDRRSASASAAASSVCCTWRSCASGSSASSTST